MKTGTHLIQELMVALGYGMYGSSRVTADIRPLFDDAIRRRVAEMVYDEDVLARLDKADEAEFRAETDRAWDALGWAWQLKFGLPLENRYGLELIDTDLVRQARHRLAASDFADTPPGICWVVPEFDIKKIDGRFIREWHETGEPRIIFNYRDPRDTLLSMVNFLDGKTAGGYGSYSEFQAFSRILGTKETIEDKLTYAMSDPSFPGNGDFERSQWLLDHPGVCKVSFEELVGPRGGGTVEAQQAALQRILSFLGVDAPSDQLSQRLFRRDSFSFYKGQIGSWRKAFTQDHTTMFMHQWGTTLRKYGYAAE
ncbi:hypothetical protein E1193_14175 [Micromonospora sp. KC606]|uniref:hypothetical protein n=1 Tax=Micromonospora sp. KC606 TaxID=2530379 RepID=UPI001053B6A6|nr:hypothetical protein [Micromonospora sp. KC606]TDC81657.1 hypothetical protein E1193_14175 [Micromonospora sp. KC606]